MKKKVLASCFAILLCASCAQAGFWGDLFKTINPSSGGLTLEKTIAGLKEALSVGSGNAVNTVSTVNGYFKNPDIKILMPEKIQNVADMLRKVGLGSTVDEFELSMNQAAEKAAPKAKELFIGSIKQMTFDDAKKILNGGDTSATEYLQGKTTEPLTKEFAPIIASSLDQVGATKSYRDMMAAFTALPFMSAQSFDLDNYVTEKALGGLFHMVGEEEKDIRANPQARVTDLLKEVFGNK
jgi:hypothetical protein